MLIPRYTAEFRERELERGRRSLFYFGVSILGFSARHPLTGEPQIGDLHHDLCAFLEGRAPHHPWRRAMVCCFRGAGKSVWTTETYPMWRGLYIVNFSTKIIENSSDNAKYNHFLPIFDLFTSSDRADYLQWLYEHRLPTGFEGWTKEQIKLVQTDPNAAPCLSYFGIESKIEGAHVDLVALDDPEGADAAKSQAANEEAFQAYQKAIPLLKHPMYSQILVTLTPHGRRPLAYRFRDREKWQSEADNARTEFKIFWRPVVDGSGRSQWPERFPEEALEGLRKEPTFNQQFLLEREESTLQLFDMRTVQGSGVPGDTGSCYDWLDRGTKSAIVYPGFDYQPDKLGDPGYLLPLPVRRTANLREMRFYIHFDPLHRTALLRRSPAHKQRPALAAITVVGFTRDFHGHLMDYWTKDADINEQIVALFNLYRVWCPALVTFEAVGAQFWLGTLVSTAYERHNDSWRNPVSTDRLGPPISLPRLSLRLTESPHKTTDTKEWLWREEFAPWVNRAIFHFRPDQDEALYQLKNVLNEDVACDLIDATTQGTKVWAPPVGDLQERQFHEYVARVESKLAAGIGAVSGWMERTGYRAPWGRS